MRAPTLLVVALAALLVVCACAQEPQQPQQPQQQQQQQQPLTPEEFRVRIVVSGEEDLRALEALGVPLARRVRPGAGSVEAYPHRRHLRALEANGFSYALLPHTRDTWAAQEAQQRLRGRSPAITYTHYDELQTWLANVHQQYPHITQLGSAGVSVNGRQLSYIRITANPTQDEAEPKFKFVGNMHGDETVGRVCIIQLIDLLTSQYAHDEHIRALVDNTDIYLMPSMNPDGFEAIHRSNAHGYDLNRNFPDQFEGQRYTPQAESLHMRTWMSSFSFNFTLSANLHGGDLVANYAYDGNAIHRSGRYSSTADDDVMKELALTYSNAHPRMHLSHSFHNGITNGADWYILYGGMQDYNYLYESCPELTMELSYTKRPPESQLQGFWDENRPAMLSYMRAAHRGVHGLVTDALTGQPLRATVHVLTQQGEDTGRMLTHSTASVGDYHRILSRGTYTLKFTCDGYDDLIVSDVVVPIPVENSSTGLPQHATVNVQLTPSS